MNTALLIIPTFYLFILMVLRDCDGGLQSPTSTFTLDGETLCVEPEDPQSAILERHRRYLLYRPMSIFQFTVAYSMPVELMPKRFLNIVLGSQIAFDLPYNLTQLTVQTVARQAARPEGDIALPHALRAAETMLEQKGLPGRACMLLAVCQLAETPLEREAGLLEDIVHLMLTPSENSHQDDWSTREEQKQYLEAENIGREGNTDCRTAFPQCNVSLMDAFSRIMLT